METGIPTPAQGAPAALYGQPQYLLRRKMLKLLGGRIDIYDPLGNPVMCCLQKAFKLKEDISLFTDDSKRVELLRIKARQIIDFSAAYDVVDAQTGQTIGVLRRKGWQSLVRDAWEILDSTERVVATIQEDNMLLALVRRFLTNLIPQSFAFTTPTGQPLATAHQRFNPFIHRMDLVMPQGPGAAVLDPRMAMTAAVLLVLIEGRQN
ncbi:MAG: hypothetical protein ACYDBB_11020 [Armatimonadota bacterium]